jgi:hypothetical protein
VYASVVDISEELLLRVQNCCTSVSHTTGIFQHIQQSTHSQACEAVKGQHFEHRDPNNNCYCLSLKCKTTFLLNRCIIIEQTSLVLDIISLANV